VATCGKYKSYGTSEPQRTSDKRSEDDRDEGAHGVADLHTRKRREMVHITGQVEEIVRRSGVDNGLCFVSPMHITADVYANDNEEGLTEDIGI
jgi:hypothetical protein